jgi:hypothetical protein
LAMFARAWGERLTERGACGRAAGSWGERCWLLASGARGGGWRFSDARGVRMLWAAARGWAYVEEWRWAGAARGRVLRGGSGEQLLCGIVRAREMRRLELVRRTARHGRGVGAWSWARGAACEAGRCLVRMRRKKMGQAFGSQNGGGASWLARTGVDAGRMGPAAGACAS